MPSASSPGPIPTETVVIAPPAPQRRRSTTWVSIALIVIGAALVLSFPTIAPNPYILSAGVVILNFAVLSTGWNFMGGFTGYISLGHAAYFGLGAYGTALLIKYLALPGFVAWILAAVLVAIIAVPIGIAALRVRGASFVIVSIAFVLIMLLVFQSWREVTGGSDGLNVPRPFPDLLRPEHHRVFYYLYAGLLAFALVVWWIIDRSKFGTALKSIREDEDKARSLGVPTTRYKLIAYVLSALMVSLGGGLYALWFGDLDPIFQFSILIGSYMVLMALLGGVRNLFGPLLGAVVVGTALEYFKVEFGDTQFHLIATGILLGVVVLFMPDGVIPAVKALFTRGSNQASIREVTAGELLEQNESRDAPPTPQGPKSVAGQERSS
ncbi:branched-chain amino acid ABC transporter permease [Microbacterium sp.]|uniref:branched-chain amino acid ABC transporter permease n=1 Tax=Microbacterium sp. TaxID=51671 RepID=UPI00281123D7|nr:branched-chain amino acid ABC transporter permease [Microbacterium sp.]